MLKYLWTVTQDLFVVVTLVTWIHAVLGRLYGRAGRRFNAAGIIVGVVASAALAAVKGTTNKIISSHWNHYIFAAISLLSLLFVIFCLIFGRREDSEWGVGGTLLCLFGAGLSAAHIFYALPGVMLYPFNFNTMGEGYLSAYYMTRLAGWLLALLLLLVYSRTLYICALHIKPLGTLSALLCGGVLVNLFYSGGRFFAPWVTRAKWLKWPVRYSKESHALIGNWLSITVNHSMVFIWLIFLLAAASLVICFVQNTKVTEPWDNPAQHRKLRARNRSRRRTACVAFAGLIVFALCLTAVKGYDTRVIELSAPETYTVDGDRILVPMDAVNDFHLHRFEYRHREQRGRALDRGAQAQLRRLRRGPGRLRRLRQRGLLRAQRPGGLPPLRRGDEHQHHRLQGRLQPHPAELRGGGRQPGVRPCGHPGRREGIQIDEERSRKHAVQNDSRRAVPPEGQDAADRRHHRPGRVAGHRHAERGAGRRGEGEQGAEELRREHHREAQGRLAAVGHLRRGRGGEALNAAYLREDELGKLKTIFWAFNIVDFTPFLDTRAALKDGSEVQVVGTWFNHHLALPTGEELDAGVAGMRSWWEITDGRWLNEADANANNEIMVGAALAEEKRWTVGEKVALTGSHGKMDAEIVGIFDAGGDEDSQIFATLDAVQALTDREGKVASIEVSALTTPDNDLARRAARNPAALTSRDYETWYCTAYVSAICYQIQEVITGSVASAVRQVAESEGTILDKTKLLMILITALSLIGSALGISNLVTASVMERAQEIGLLKAIGAKDRSITGVVMTEILITALVGFAAGYFMGFGFAQLIGHSVFGSAIDMDTRVIPIVAGLIALVTIAGSLPAIRMVLRLRPAEVLHGGH